MDLRIGIQPSLQEYYTPAGTGGAHAKIGFRDFCEMYRRLTAMLLFACLGFADVTALSRARDLYQRTAYEQALKALEEAPQADALVYALAGQCHFHLEDFKRAVEDFEKVVAADPGNSEYYDWLGKAWGRRAENSSFLTAPRYATRARDAFEKAVELNSRNLEAVSDLFEYYLEAPGFLGGGKDKAAQLAETIKEVDRAEYHYLQARLAEKRKDFSAAEEHYRAAAKFAPEQPGRLLDLAGFLSRQERYQQSETVFQDAEKLAPNDPKVVFARANAYVKAGRKLAEARRLLRQYIESDLTPEHPSRNEARKLLEKAAKS